MESTRREFIGAGASLAVDWPIGYDDLDDYYCRSEEHLAVRGYPARAGEPPRECRCEQLESGYSGGVVDSSCRVFGVDNLYVSGASVCPTAGTSNPTLTVVALTLRLADHLLERVL